MGNTAVVFERRQTLYLEITEEVLESLMDMTLEEYLLDERGSEWETDHAIDMDVLQS